ncbi:MAG: CAP domain-containing protein [Isosphaeraceae bacterium]
MFDHLARFSRRRWFGIAPVGLLGGLGGCISVRRQPAGPRPDPRVAFQGLVEAHNRERTRRGRKPLELDSRLAAAAQGHANEMARRRWMSHRGADGSSPATRIERVGYAYSRVAENVAFGQYTLDELMGDWMRSPGHRRNILGSFYAIGTGYATDANGKPYWCVTFGTPRGESGPA